MSKIRNNKFNILTEISIVVSILLGCTNEDATNSVTKDETPFEVRFDAAPKTETDTRTGGVEEANRLDFLWTKTDYKYLFVDLNTNASSGSTANWKTASYQRTLETDANDSTQIKRASFSFEGFPVSKLNQYAFRYVGNSTDPTRVNIRNVQRQTGTATFADQLGENGDCFVGWAYGHQQIHRYQPTYDWWYGTYMLYSNNNSYYYKGQSYYSGHKASYISFMVYNRNGALSNTYIRQIKITANEAINGRRPFSESGIDLTSRPTSGINKSTRLEISDGLSIAANRADARKKAAIIVAFPGEYTNVRLEIQIVDPTSGVTLNIDKTYPKMKLEEGKNLPMYFALNFPDYTPRFESYHMWGAKDYYWMPDNPLVTPHAWSITGGTGEIPAPASPNDVWPKVDTDSRWYETEEYEVQSGTLDYTADVPTPNDVSYIFGQDCYWDANTAYVYDGHLFKGLLWIPRITKGHANANDGNDWTTSPPSASASTKTPTAGVHNVSGYFALPALGYWVDGKLSNVGKEGRYWLWNCDPDDPDRNAYSLYFSASTIRIDHATPKKYGCLSMPKE